MAILEIISLVSMAVLTIGLTILWSIQPLPAKISRFELKRKLVEHDEVAKLTEKRRQALPRIKAIRRVLAALVIASLVFCGSTLIGGYSLSP